MTTGTWNTGPLHSYTHAHACAHRQTLHATCLALQANIWRRACAASQQAARIHSIEEDYQNFYIVQERCRGGSLQQLVDSGEGLNEEELGEVAFCVLTFLSSMHRNGIYYGDLKPGNVILKDACPHPCSLPAPDDTSASADAARSSRCMNVRVVDFGSSQLVSSTPLRGITGTPFFLAPEVIGGSYGLPADMFALGVMLYTLVTPNKLPFWLEPINQLEDSLGLSGDSMQEGAAALQADAIHIIFDSIVHNPVIFAGAKWKGVSEPLKDLICSLLAKDPADRLTAQQALEHPFFATALDACLV
jgi:serine/threonine protein kinase